MEVNLIAVFTKSGEKYIIMYSDENAQKALRQLGRWAADKSLDFTWHDAAVGAKRMRSLNR